MGFFHAFQANSKGTSGLFQAQSEQRLRAAALVPRSGFTARGKQEKANGPVISTQATLPV
jgi:hypothetical protein